MNIFGCFKHIVPEFHAYSDQDKRYNIGATWTAQDGLQDFHNLELKYVHNSERLALQGDPQPDGSWKYVAPDGTLHTITSERAKHFMDQTTAHANIMCDMLEKLRSSGVMGDALDTSAEPV